MKRFTQILGCILGCLLICNLALAIHVFREKQQLRSAHLSYMLGEKISLASGIRINGLPWEAPVAPCWVIRFTNDHCPYCKADIAAYERFITAARTSACEIIELAPRAGDLSEQPRDGVTQLKFVRADIGRAIYPLVTPLTIIVDSSQKVRWIQRGTFTSSTLKGGIEMLRSFPKQMKD